MKFEPPLQQARLIRRYKRFLADVEMADGRSVVIHCPNTGSMLNCQDAGCRIWYSTSENKSRKYRHTWEIIENSNGELIGINTGRANRLVREAVEKGVVIEASGYDTIRSEVSYGRENSRVDLLLTGAVNRVRPDCYIEVKSVTLSLGEGLGMFPDAVTIRGQKHIRELIEMRRSGARAMLFFCVQHTGIRQVSVADHIDPVYGELVREAARSGVELVAYGSAISSREIRLLQAIPVEL